MRIGMLFRDMMNDCVKGIPTLCVSLYVPTVIAVADI